MKKIIRKVLSIFAAKILPEVPYPVLKGPLKGLKIVLGSLAGRGKGASVYLNQVEREQTIEFLNRVKKDTIVFDVGANVGYYTLLASLQVGTNGKVFAFEPVVRNLSYLNRHIELNRLKNVVVLPLACSDKSELVEFSFGANRAEGHLIEVDDAKSTDEKFFSYTYVHTISLDEFVHYSKNSPNIIKIDVEGAELLVLKGAKEILKNNKPVIFLSIHSEELEITCKEFLLEFDYEFILLDEKERPSVEYLCM